MEPESNRHLKVVDALPHYVQPQRTAPGYPLEASGATAQGVYEVYHHCPHCGGWIAGAAVEQHVSDDMRKLSGRRGTTFYCRRCAWQIGFTGAMA
ncbi:MAG: hypothetical protein OHK0046_47750 [Anaerolineae bacterium]